MSSFNSTPLTTKTDSRIEPASLTSNHYPYRHKSGKQEDHKDGQRKNETELLPTTVILSPSLAGLTEGAFIEAAVVGYQCDNLPIALTDNATLALFTEAKLSIGTKIRAKINSISHRDASGLLVSTDKVAMQPPQPVSLVLVDFENTVDSQLHDIVFKESEPDPVLVDTILTALGLDPSLTRKFITDSLPGFDEFAATRLFSLLRAIANNDLANWFGKPMIEILQNAGENSLIDRLSKVFLPVDRNLAAAHKNSSWLHIALPFFDGKNFNNVGLAVRLPRYNQGKAEKKTRFIVDFRTYGIGALQLDGLFDECQFDLYVRTEKDLSDEAKVGIKELFSEAQNVTNAAGDIRFQRLPRKPFVTENQSGLHSNNAHPGTILV